MMARSTSGKRRRKGAGSTPNGGATTGYEAKLWAMAAALRGSMDAAEYKHVVLGQIFLKYISDAFEERRAAVLATWGEDAAEDRDEYTAENIFWVPPEARWANLKAQARQSTIGLTVDAAMAAIERDNPALKDMTRSHHGRHPPILTRPTAPSNHDPSSDETPPRNLSMARHHYLGYCRGRRISLDLAVGVALGPLHQPPVLPVFRHGRNSTCHFPGLLPCLGPDTCSPWPMVHIRVVPATLAFPSACLRLCRLGRPPARRHASPYRVTPLATATHRSADHRRLPARDGCAAISTILATETEHGTLPYDRPPLPPGYMVLEPCP